MEEQEQQKEGKEGLGDAVQSDGPGQPLQFLAEDGSGISAHVPIAASCSLVGQMVWTGVQVCGEWHRMAKGRVVRQDGNIYHVDVMSHHGGAPWVRMETHVERI